MLKRAISAMIIMQNENNASYVTIATTPFQQGVANRLPCYLSALCISYKAPPPLSIFAPLLIRGGAIFIYAVNVTSATGDGYAPSLY